MSTFYTTSFSSPVGELRLAVNGDGALVALVYEDLESLPLNLGQGAIIIPDSARTAQAIAELQDYFTGRLRVFEVPIAPAIGTPFQRRVWDGLTKIPYGETWSYTRLAAEVGSVARAVGSANGANPISIVVPCHRVIGADGSLIGYAGGLERKRALLIHEGVLLG